MHFSATRGLGKTYGKAKKNVLVHDLFEYRVTQTDRSATAPSNGLPAPTSDTPSNLASQANVQRGKSQQPGAALPRSSRSDVVDRAPALASKTPAVEDKTLFDINSSDEDTSTDISESRASKRRRVVRVLNDARPHALERSPPAPPESKNMPAKIGKPKKQQNSTVQPIESETILNKPLPLNPSKTSSGVTKTSSRTYSSERGSAKPLLLSRITKSKSPTISDNYSEEAQAADQSATDASECLSDRSRHSVAHAGGTPKRKRLSLSVTDSELSSPSRLGLTALKLSAAGLSPARLSLEPSSDESSTRKQGRRRLIDRLDAPTKTREQTSEVLVLGEPTTSITVKSQKPSKNRGRSIQDSGKKHQLQRSISASEGSETSQNRINRATKPRTTYATQRSHLSDMVDDLDALGAPPSQKSVDELLLQAPVSNLASQLELEEEESDDQVGAGRLKSIHELRQAGANNRFDREVDALLEDISANDLSVKAIRLQALMKLVQKLDQPAFLRHLASSGRIQRLTLVANQSMDLPTSVLLVVAFLSLAKAEIVPLDNLGQLFRAATVLAPKMFADNRPLSSIAKERKQNLSKAMVQELAEFETGHKSSITPRQLCPDVIALKCLEQTLRKMVQMGDSSAALPTPVYVQVLRLLQSHVQHLQSNNQSLLSVSKLETALSLLELCSVVVDDADLDIGDDEYEALGNSFAEIVYKTGNQHQSLEKSVLRVVVSLSNNKPRMCRLLGHTAINKAAFGIINDNFLQLARQAESEQALDEGKLDSVVLALGCLLNFAECDSSLRIRLSHMDPGKGNYIEQLVSIFNIQVSKVDEAMTKEQSQVSVAFGYLSMLLCTLSLHPSIRNQVTQLLKDKSFEELCTAAEKFFSHLRTLEHISEDDASMSTFTARFGAILETIRGSSK